MIKNKIVIGVALFSLILVGFSCDNNQAQDEDVDKETALDQAEEVKDAVSDKLDVKEKEIVDEMKEETTNLIAVGGYSGTGVATRSYDGSTFKHVVEAELSDPAPGKFYEGWLVAQSPSLNFFSTGRMEKQGDNYILTYRSNEDKSSFNEVVITEETESLGLDGNPEAHVLEGEF